MLVVERSNRQNLVKRRMDSIISRSNNREQANFLYSNSVRFRHGYVTRSFQQAKLVKQASQNLRCGWVLAVYIYFRLETLSRFRRLRRVDMYRRRTLESREPVFIVGTLLASRASAREGETGMRIVYMDKWFNRFQFDFRSSAINFLGFANWDLRSFFGPRKSLRLGRKKRS